MSPGERDPLALVRASPAAVAAHDKEAWLGLFARDYVLEDPVGSRPVVGSGLDRFWDTFIAPNDITFQSARDVVHGMVVARDVVIEIHTPPDVTVRTPAHLVYELAEEDDALRIRRMAAHWELVPALRQMARPTASHVRALARQSGRLVTRLGPGGALAFAGAVRSVGGPGKRAVNEFLAAARRGDATALQVLGGVVPESPGALIASGQTVTATCAVDGVAAMLVCHLARRDRRVARCDLYVDGRR